jgi:DNA-binding CsgD family transcriptional regulator
LSANRLPVKIASFILMGVGIVLLGLTIYTRGEINLALPLVFLVLGGGFLLVLSYLQPKWSWATFLFTPAALLIAFGIIFLFNQLTGDWTAWAYAWLLLVSALGIGMLLTNRSRFFSPTVNLVGWVLTLGGITFFAIFGVIAGGLFIKVFAPIFLVSAGLSLRFLHLESILTPSFLSKWNVHANQEIKSTGNDGRTVRLVEQLSSRELEVLQLIVTGLSNQQIADKLSVAPSTIKTHINNLYGKLGVQTRVQAVNRARELNLIDS